MNESFEPIIVAYCCQWCSYAAADLAGSMRLQYPPNVRIVRIPCTGWVDILFLLRALEKGADGVFVSGCRLGDCHFLTGNYKMEKRMAYTKKLLTEIGLDPGRVELYFNSAAMEPQFAQTCRDFTARIRHRGPLWKSAMIAAWSLESGRTWRRGDTRMEPIAIKKVKDILGYGRSGTVPVLDYLDVVGFTSRQGNERILTAS